MASGQSYLVRRRGPTSRTHEEPVVKTESCSATSAPHPRHGRRQRLVRAAVFALLAAALGWAAPGARPGAAQGSDGPWAPATFMLQPRSESAIAQLEGRLYVLGGYPVGRLP